MDKPKPEDLQKLATEIALFMSRDWDTAHRSFVFEEEMADDCLRYVCDAFTVLDCTIVSVFTMVRPSGKLVREVMVAERGTTRWGEAATVLRPCPSCGAIGEADLFALNLTCPECLHEWELGRSHGTPGSHGAV